MNKHSIHHIHILMKNGDVITFETKSFVKAKDFKDFYNNVFLKELKDVQKEKA